MNKRFTVWQDRTAGGKDVTYIADNARHTPDGEVCFVGTFGEECAELAEQCAEALNAGAQTYFVGAEFRQKTCYLHIKRRNGDCTQSIVERHHGSRLLAALCRRHPQMIVDLFLVFDRCQMHRTYSAKDSTQETDDERS